MRFELFAPECPCKGCTRKDSSRACVTSKGRLCPLWHASQMHPGLDGRGCALAGNFAMEELWAFGYWGLAVGIRSDFEPALAKAFGHELLAAVHRVRAQAAGAFGAGQSLRRYTSRSPRVRTYMGVLGVAAVDDAGTWFLKVARHGYRVIVRHQ